MALDALIGNNDRHLGNILLQALERPDDGNMFSLRFIDHAAYTPNADPCRACGLCVVACPEDSITLALA